MYSLVKFVEDDILYITPSRAVTPIEGNLVLAPYKRMGFYEAIVLAKNNKRWSLQKILIEKSNDNCSGGAEKLITVQKSQKNVTNFSMKPTTAYNEDQSSEDGKVISGEKSNKDDSDNSMNQPSILWNEDKSCNDEKVEKAQKDVSDYSVNEVLSNADPSFDESGSVDSDYIPVSETSSASTEENYCDEEVGRGYISDIAESICPTKPSGLVSIEDVGCSGTKNKKYFCKYCNKLITKIARHLENVHKNEKEVQAFTRLPKGCEERKEIIKLLRGAGSIIHNTNAFYKTGNLQVSRRPQSFKNRTVKDYIVCPRCKNFYSKISIRKHAARCLKTGTRERSIIVMGRRVRSDIHPQACNVMKDLIFPYMRHDKMISLIKYDKLVIRFLNEQCLKYRSQHHLKMIKAQMRLVGRFLEGIIAIDSSIEKFSSVFRPKNFDKVLEVISSLGQYDDNKNVMKKPNVPLFIGTLLKKMAKFHKSHSILKDDAQGQKNAENFLSLIETHFNPHIGQTVLESKLYFSRQKKQEIPGDEDVHKFIFYMLHNIKLQFDQLREAYTYQIWLELASFCLMWITSFNRRRVGEVERMKIVDFENYQRVDKYAEKEIYSSLSLEGKKAVEDFIRIQLRGKLGRTVPLLLCKLVFNSISLILDHRKDACVPVENPYVFGLPGKERENHINACALLREHSEKCEAKNPHLLRGTKLRKDIATKSVMLNLNDQEVSDLANYMGHNEKIHKSHYRLPIVAREITELSKILLKAQGAEPGELNISVGTHICREKPFEESFADMSLDIPVEAAHSTPHTFKMKKTASMFLPSVKKVPWTSTEKEAAMKFFKNHISMSRTPKLQECFEAIGKFDALQERSPQAIKT